MQMRFEWDLVKAKTNLRKHGVSFETATLVFADPFALFDQDRIDAGELRWIAIGSVDGLRVLVVAHVVRVQDGEEVIRIISARKADRKEKRRYEEDDSVRG